MVEQQDVTARLEALGIHSLSFDGQSALIDSIAEVMTDSVKKIEKTLHVEIDPYYEGNQYFATTYRLFPRRAPRFRRAKVDGQVRRRDRQLDVAAPDVRLQRVPHIRRPRDQRPGGVFGAQRALPPEDVGARVVARLQGRRLRHDHRLSRKHGALPLVLRHQGDARRRQRHPCAGARTGSRR